MPEPGSSLRANNLLKVLFVLLSYGLYLLIGYVIERENFGGLMTVFTILFALYILACSHIPRLRIRDMLLIGLLFRLSFFLATPELSDDFYRFVWDGRLTAHGMNPYLSMPENDFQEATFGELGLNDVVYEGLNSKGYYTIYPPVAQGVFVISSFLGNGDINSEIISIRLLLILAELVTMMLIVRILVHFKLPAARLKWYALNPLVILEVAGNLHFEGLMLMFILLATWLWLIESWVPSALSFGLAISTKLLPIMLLPLIIRQVGFKKTLIYSTVALATAFLTVAPFASKELFFNMWSSIELYFRSFEFNASIYYMLRQVGDWISGYNLIRYIGPALSVGTLLFILRLSLKKSVESNWFHLAVVAMSAYFFMSTTVHPWYIITLVGLGVVGGVTYPVWWSFLVLLSYSHYSGGVFQENYVLIAAEYILLVVGIIIILRKPEPLNLLAESSAG